VKSWHENYLLAKYHPHGSFGFRFLKRILKFPVCGLKLDGRVSELGTQRSSHGLEIMMNVVSV
jgi:hypothetical protein